MSATMHDVARIAGVSIKTVSNVVNDFEHVRPSTRQRVQDAISELGYRPNLSARGLRSGRSGVIALLIPDLRNAYFAELADSVMRAAAKENLAVFIQQIGGFGGGREAEIEALRGQRMTAVDGIIYSVLELGESDVALLDISTPLVLLGERIFSSPNDHVTMPNIEAAEAATAHLISLGRTRIAALGVHEGEVIGSAGLRLEGYRRAHAKAGIEVDERLLLPCGSWHRADGAAAMREFLAADIDFDGVVAFNDAMALGAMRVVQEAGLAVPRDVAMIGFDDIDETRYSLPTLSTIDPGRDEIAESAVRLLRERIDAADPVGKKAFAGEALPDLPPRRLTSSYSVVQRESSTI